MFTVAAAVLGAVRKAKSDGKVSMRADVARVVVTDTADRLAALEAARDDVMNAGVDRGARSPWWGSSSRSTVTLATPPS